MILISQFTISLSIQFYVFWLLIVFHIQTLFRLQLIWTFCFHCHCWFSSGFYYSCKGIWGTVQSIRKEIQLIFKSKSHTHSHTTPFGMQRNRHQLDLIVYNSMYNKIIINLTAYSHRIVFDFVSEYFHTIFVAHFIFGLHIMADDKRQTIYKRRKLYWQQTYYMCNEQRTGVYRHILIHFTLKMIMNVECSKRIHRTMAMNCVCREKKKKWSYDVNAASIQTFIQITHILIHMLNGEWWMVKMWIILNWVPGAAIKLFTIHSM